MSYVFLHGLGQTPDSWDQVISNMSFKEETLCPSLPEMLHGRECNYQNLYGAFCRCCQREPGKIDLCGLSLGGILSLHYATEHPENVKSLVLIGTQYVMPKKLLKIQSAVFRLMPAKAFASMGFSKKDFLQLSGTMADLDLSGGLDSFVCPTLVVCGEKDKANRKASEELAERIPNASLRLIPGSGHEVNRQAPARLADVLEVFWKK